MLSQRLHQPGIKVHLFAITSPHQIWFPSEQTFRRGQSDEIFRRFYFVFEVFVFRLDVGDRFRRSMGLAVANEGRVRFSDVIEKIIDALLERFGRETSIGEAKGESENDKKPREKDHDYYFAADRLFALPIICRSCGAPGVTRTLDLRIRNPLLYPAELRAHCPEYLAAGRREIQRNSMKRWSPLGRS